ncbi:MAG: FAD-dependent monooxygenase [Hyphomicrobiales bacterium]|nr:FAD-dependent monooxygenase [Hyphomicrobiales bacterium]
MAYNPPRQHVVTGGGGIVGLALALQLRQSVPALVDVTVCDPGLARARKAGRVSTLAAGPRRFLERLGVWHELGDAASPVTAMHISDSQLEDALRPIYLKLSGEISPGEAFAHVVSEEVLIGKLRDACARAGVSLRATAVADDRLEGEDRAISLADGSNLRADLLVGADGRPSPIRTRARIGVSRHDYGQSGLVATLQLERPHGGIAVQHFLPGGPFALLPMAGNRASIVWSQPHAAAQRLASLDDGALASEIEICFGHHLGRITLLDRPQLFPLALGIARSFIAPRLALAGDAAHGIHPLAGQGLNLGLADAEALAAGVGHAAGLGLPIGNEETLEDYQRTRRAPAVAMAAAMEGFNALFSNDIMPLRRVRDLGMGVVDRAPGLKARIIRQAAGLTAPRDAPPRQA